MLLFSQKKEYDIHYFGYREGLAEQNVTRICHERNGAVWFGAERGLFRWDGRELLDFTPKFGLSANVNLYVLALVEDKYRWLWVATKAGLFRLPPDRSRCEKLLDTPAYGLVTDDAQNLLVLLRNSPKPNQLLRIRLRAGAPPLLDSLQTPGGAPTHFFPAPNGGWWVQTTRQETFRWLGGQFAREAIGPLPGGFEFSQDFLHLPSGRTCLLVLGVDVAVFFENGAYTTGHRDWLSADTSQWAEPYDLYARFIRYVDQNTGIFPREKRSLIGLPVCAEPDRYGNLWCAGQAGVFVLSPRQNGLYHLPYTLGRSMRAIFSDKNGLWTSTVEKDMFLQKKWGGPAETLQCVHSIRAMFPIDSDTYVLGGDFFELYLLDSKTKRIRMFESAAGNNFSYCGVSDGRFVWLVRGGLFRLDLHTRLRRFFPLNIPNLVSKSTQIAPDGSLWIASNIGLLRVPVSPDGVPAKADTLLCGTELPGSLLVGDTLWLGTGGHGLWRYECSKRQVTARYTTVEGLCDNFVNCILRDPEKGHLWISTNKGLSRFDPRTQQFLNFDESDGLRNVEYNTSSAWRDPLSGRMFFGGLNGVTYFHPADIQKRSNEPAVFLSKILRPSTENSGQFDALYPDIDSLKDFVLYLSPIDRFVEFYLASSDLTAPEQNRFFYRLEGFDPEWVAAGSNPVVRFTNLPAGDFVFHFKTSNRDGRISAERTLHLHVEPIFYKTWWFAFLSVGALVGLVFGYFQLKLRQVQQIHSERKRIADDLHDDVAATISQLSVLAKSLGNSPRDAPELPAALQKIGSLSDEGLAKLADIVWAVDERRQTLGDLANRLQDQAEMLLQPLRIRLRAQLELTHPERNLKSAVRHHVLLMFKESLHNIIRHTESQVVFFIIENRGRDLSVVIENEFSVLRQGVRSSGKGLDSMAGRARQLGGRFETSKTETTFRVAFFLPDVFE